MQTLQAALKVSYANLMSFAGYAVPKGGGDPSGNMLARALGAETLTPEEVETLALYLAWFRHRTGRM
jgi:hypothetical protein